MAQNRGVSGDVFTTEVAALSWLDGQLARKTGSSSSTNPVLKPPV